MTTSSLLLRSSNTIILLHLLVFAFLCHIPVWSFSASSNMPSSPQAANKNNKEIYGVPGSGWTSPRFLWGYADGTGHDCAAICRQIYANRAARQDLVETLLSCSAEMTPTDRLPANFEEVKLILALAWQRGRWDGSDGGPDGYGSVLSTMAAADRYENGTSEECARRFIQDMVRHFPTLEGATPEATEATLSLIEDDDFDAAQRRCSGMVLNAMGFVERGL